MAGHYDMIVIGGGSGGLAASKAAAKLGKKVVTHTHPLSLAPPSPSATGL